MQNAKKVMISKLRSNYKNKCYYEVLRYMLIVKMAPQISFLPSTIKEKQID